LKTLVLDLDETLVHSTFDYIDNPDLIINMEVDEIVYEIFVLIRPGCFEFIEELSKYYELVIFTASLSKVNKMGNLK
jgi:carboxy-terminal domain RNA polymerase II polypeptide A small phosphatase